ncbi:MAG TPA: 50S ribosomal protein L1 [Melioribacteraceae bacterium]|nr:50S ribosomal protein L1 [Melioribacteraceae bacterium]
MKVSKRLKELRKQVDLNKEYTLEEAIATLKSKANAKFVETLDCAIRLGIDPKKADQAIRNTVILPHGVGKTVRVLVMTPSKAQEALDAGADYAGYTEYVEKIKAGWSDVDVVIATPDAMVEVGKLGKILGPRGLMPNPKTGTVTMDVAKAVKESKAGKIEFRNEKGGIIHVGLGKINFEPVQLKENALAFLNQIVRLKPTTVKGQYIKSCYLSTTMGVGIKLSNDELTGLTK